MPDNRRVNGIVALVIALGISIGSWQLYAYLGAPKLPGPALSSATERPRHANERYG